MTGRADTARAIVDALSQGGQDERRMLTGGGLSPAEMEARITIDGAAEPSPANLAREIFAALGMRGPDRPLGPKDFDVADLALMREAVTRGSVLREREDGVTFYAVPDREDPEWVIAQVAVVSDGSGHRALAGAYYHTSLFVNEEFRGRGIGSDLVVEHVLQNGGALTWEAATCDYSPGGAAAHMAALRKLESVAASEPEPDT